MNTTPRSTTLLTADEAALQLRISLTTLNKLVRNNEIEVVRIGRARRFPADGVARYIQEHRSPRTTESYTVAQAREQLLDDLTNAQNWRSLKAADYPENGRNQRSVETLGLLIDHVRMLPDDDPRFTAVTDLMTKLPTGWPIVTNLASRVGFWKKPTDLDEVFSFLVAEAVRAAQETSEADTP